MSFQNLKTNKLYLIYLHKDINLYSYIKKHQDVSEKGLVTKLIVEFQHYGLGKYQYCRLLNHIVENNTL